MITWPIFVALFLSISAVYLSVQAEKNKKDKKKSQKEKEEFKRLDLIERKKRIENQIHNQSKV